MKKLAFILLSAVLNANVHIVQDKNNITVSVRSWIEIKNKNLTRQKYDYSCGSAALSTILTYFYEHNTTEREILDTIMRAKGLTQSSTLEDYKKANGLSFLDLSEVAFSKGFQALGLALDMESLKKLKVPAILYVKLRKNEHFTVFKGMDEEYVYLADPSFGNTKIKLSKFQEMFYQRDDRKYPAKALIVFPPSNTPTNNSFMSIPPKETITQKTIRLKAIRN